MATKFMTLDGQKSEKKETVFTHCVNSSLKIVEVSRLKPTKFSNVLHIGCDHIYGDVFKAWENDKNVFTIFFGTAGDEF
jgi:hypothetical protein